jgi:hypothetical protein
MPNWKLAYAAYRKAFSSSSAFGEHKSVSFQVCNSIRGLATYINYPYFAFVTDADHSLQVWSVHNLMCPVATISCGQWIEGSSTVELTVSNNAKWVCLVALNRRKLLIINVDTASVVYSHRSESDLHLAPSSVTDCVVVIQDRHVGERARNPNNDGSDAPMTNMPQFSVGIKIIVLVAAEGTTSGQWREVVCHELPPTCAVSAKCLVHSWVPSYDKNTILILPGLHIADHVHWNVRFPVFQVTLGGSPTIVQLPFVIEACDTYHVYSLSHLEHAWNYLLTAGLLTFSSADIDASPTASNSGANHLFTYFATVFDASSTRSLALMHDLAMPPTSLDLVKLGRDGKTEFLTEFHGPVIDGVKGFMITGPGRFVTISLSEQRNAPTTMEVAQYCLL